MYGVSKSTTWHLYFWPSLFLLIGFLYTYFSRCQRVEECTVFNSDIRGFTRMSEGTTPEVLVEMLNEYFELMVDTIFKYDGTLDKFMGDGITMWMAVPIAFLAAGLIGWMNGTFVNRTGLPSFIVTLATFFILRGVMEIGLQDGSTRRFHPGEQVVGPLFEFHAIFLDHLFQQFRIASRQFAAVLGGISQVGDQLAGLGIKILWILDDLKGRGYLTHGRHLIWTDQALGPSIRRTLTGGITRSANR